MENLKSSLEFAIKKIIGKKCWEIVAGPGTGSMATFKIGESVDYRLPVRDKNNELTFKIKKKGEYTIFLRCCAWRVTLNEEPFCFWSNSEEAIKIKLDEISESTVSSIQILNSNLDLQVVFEKNNAIYELIAFCDQSERDNYYFYNPDGCFVVGANKNLTFGEKDGA